MLCLSYMTQYLNELLPGGEFPGEAGEVGLGNPSLLACNKDQKRERGGGGGGGEEEEEERKKRGEGGRKERKNKTLKTKTKQTNKQALSTRLVKVRIADNKKATHIIYSPHTN